jgi:hypothetical protein
VVRGGKTELATEAVAANDRSREGVGATKHLAGAIKVAARNGFADARAADCFAIKRDSGQPVNGKIEFLPEFLEQLDIASSFVAEDEISSNANGLERRSCVT